MTKSPFGGWSMCESAFNLILSTLKDGSTLLELGSGNVTFELCKHYTVYSVEHNSKFIGKCPHSTYIHAPLVDEWYDVEILKKCLPVDYEFICVDGPPTYARRLNMLKHLDLFKRVPMLVDDCKVKHDPNLAKSLADKFQLTVEFISTVDCQGYDHFYSLLLPN